MRSDLPLCKLSDEEVVELAKSGSENAYNHIIARYRNFVYAKAKAYYMKGAEQEDIVQEGMIGLYKAVRDFDSSYPSFCAFAKVCVLRQMLTAVKTSTRDKHKPLNSYVSLDMQSDDEACEENFINLADESNSHNPESILIDRENLSGISYRINQILSEMELKVLAFYLDGLTYQEISEKIDKDAKAVDNAVQRIRKKIGKILEE